MKKYDFNHFVERTKTDSMKWEYTHKFIEGAPSDALPLWVADMDFPCAEPIIDALHKRIDQKIFGYTFNGSDNYFDAVTGWFEKRFQWTVEKENIFYCPGIVPAIGFLIRILSDEGDGIIIQRPVYYPFAEKIEKNNRVVVNNPLKYDNDKYTIDYEDLEEKVKDTKNKALILCSPHNPVGRVWQAKELKKIVEICKKYNTWIISDEIHFDILRKGIVHTPIEKLCSEYKDRIITCTAPSKTFNLAGMQLSNIIINNKEMQEKWTIETSGKSGILLPNSFSIVATQAAYNDSGDWLNQANDYIDNNIDFIKEYVEQYMPKTKMIYPEGTFLVWLDLRAYSIDHKKLEDLMLHKAKVALDEGYIFGEEGIGFERINAACPRSILEKCLSRMRAVLKEFE